MKKNSKGFTLVELLAAMTILGIIMALTVPNVLKITESNIKQGYVTDANKLIDLAKYEIAKDRSLKPNSTNSCTVLGLGYLDNAEFDNPPNEGCYDVNRSYVLIRYYQHEYHYYVRLVEAYKVDNETKLAGIGLDSSPKYELSAEGENDITRGSVKLEQNTTIVNKFDYKTIDGVTENVIGSVSCDGVTTYRMGVEYKEYDKEIENNSEGICAWD